MSKIEKPVAVPYSLRLPPAMKADLTDWAAEDRRTLHSLLLIVIDDALQAHHARSPAAANAMTAYQPRPTGQAPLASPAEAAR
jgi:hypothetical protein